eukprot:6490615-Amphidinium_carterae.3
MRRPYLSLSKVPGWWATGQIIKDVLVKHLVGWAGEILKHAVVSREEPSWDDRLGNLRQELCRDLGGKMCSGCEGKIQVNLIEAVVALSGDPDRGLAEWFRRGAPFGIVNNIDTNSVFPAVPDERTRTAEDIPVFHGEVGEWTNYRSAEDSPHVVQQLLRDMVAQGWAVECDSVADMERKLETPMAGVPLNKLGLISKQRADGSYKHRLVWDLRRSGVNEAAWQRQRVVLPRLDDVLKEYIDIAALQPRVVKLCCVDFKDAFHTVPIHPSEAKYQAVRVADKLYYFTVLVFGSATAPTLWGRVAAFLGRSAQAIMDPLRARVNVYVDDPIFVAAGNTEEHAYSEIFLALLWWTALGFDLSWSKVSAGDRIEWIGV